VSPRVNPVRAVSALAAIATVVTIIVVLSSGANSYIVRADFKTVDGLRPGADVRVGGVKVGTVAILQLARDDAVVATLDLNKTIAPVGRDAQANVRSLNLLGGKYLDLTPGNAATEPAPSGWMIPTSRTGAPVELDDVLDVLDVPTRDRLDILINAAGLALGMRGGALSALLRALPSSLDQTTQLLSGLSSDNAALGTLIGDSSPLVGAIASQRTSLGQLVQSAESGLSATAARASDLGHTVQAAPATLTQLRTTLGELNRTAIPLRPVARELTVTARPLSAVLAEVPHAAPSLLTTLSKLQSDIPSLTALGVQATPLVSRLNPSAHTIAFVAGDAHTIGSTVDGSTPQLLQTLQGWARAIQVRDASGHLFRGQLTLSPDLLKSLLNTFIAPAGATHRTTTNAPAPTTHAPSSTAAQPPTSGATSPANGPGSGPSSGPLGGLGGVVGGVGQTLGGVLDKVLPGIAPTGTTGQTGATGDKLGALLGYLLGR
jgi:phospholipid/cholesterol/gamma-HCH transport system substrate-binding protein